MSRFLDTTTGRSVDPEFVSDQCLNCDSCRVCGKVLVYKSERDTVYRLAAGTKDGVHYKCANIGTVQNWGNHNTDTRIIPNFDFK